MNDVLDLFNCLVIDENRRSGEPCLDNVAFGFITDFEINTAQATVLQAAVKPLHLTTLFSREERETASLDQLIVKQVLHYIEVYGLNAPGLFDLECHDGEIAVLRFVHGVTEDELESMVQELLYTNAPVKDAEQVKRIIKDYGLSYDLNQVANNELRMSLGDEWIGAFTSGDDAVRYMCYKATGSALLIKSPEVIAAVKAHAWTPRFFEVHVHILAQVFNRHKSLILAAKNKSTASVINRISRLSKTLHVPLRESFAKTYVHKALTGQVPSESVSVVSVRDQMKFLNLLAQKRVQSPVSAFKIRNGKVHTRGDRPVYDVVNISRVEHYVLDSLKEDLSHLRGQTILLDKNVDYGLPVSRKQTVGNLPFGTRVTADGNELSSGMYWENAWGASDLDLSTVDMDGNRVGWGRRGSYNHTSIKYSGDLTDASDGAMEFMTSRDQDYGLFVNIYSGEPGAEMELVVGANSNTRKRWIDKPIIREKHKLNSRGGIIGFVKGKTFVVYAGRLGNKRVSGANPIINESRADLWTLSRLFLTLGIDFDVDKEPGIEYNHDLTYSSFSLDKLEAMFKNETA